MKDKVEATLRELVGVFEIDRDGDYTFRHGSTRVFIRVAPWQEENSVVGVFAWTNLRVPASPELFRYVATSNWLFGSLAAQETDEGVSLMFGHTLLGDYLDPEELKTAVGAVAFTADGIDNEIRDRFGGDLVYPT